MRIRLTLIVAALAILALAGLRPEVSRSTEPHGSAGSSGQLAGQPAPDPALPAIGSAAATASSTVQTLPHSGLSRHVRPAQAVFTLTVPAPVLPDVTTKPRSFPLLI
ncbi:MAG: hypothetical protein GEV06_05435 [Luteitalea sp.]|nr:hypothetical protein [Luteitalea sp.]